MRAVNPPSERDTLVKVRAYLTDESFGYEHWRAAQFSAPEADVQKWGVLILCETREDQERWFERLKVTPLDKG